MKKYYIRLIDRIFKILCIYEENYNNFIVYTQSIVFELNGNTEFEEICQIKFKLKSLINQAVDHKTVKKIVLDCIDILDRIISNWEDN